MHIFIRVQMLVPYHMSARISRRASARVQRELKCWLGVPVDTVNELAMYWGLFDLGAQLFITLPFSRHRHRRIDGSTDVWMDAYMRAWMSRSVWMDEHADELMN